MVSIGRIGLMGSPHLSCGVRASSGEPQTGSIGKGYQAWSEVLATSTEGLRREWKSHPYTSVPGGDEEVGVDCCLDSRGASWLVGDVDPKRLLRG